MRRILFTLVVCATVGSVVPATAVAHKHHRRHHARIHARRFGDLTAPVTTPTSSDNAGTVASLDGTTLKITLNDGSIVSGAVTPDTEIQCEAVGSSGDNMSVQDDEQMASGSGDQGQDGSGGDDNGDNTGSCSTTSLTTGAVVHAAELSISSAGATWAEVELVVSSTTPPSGPGDD